MYSYNKKKISRIINIIINIILIVVCLINIIINIDDYKRILENNYMIIRNINDLENNNFVYVNLKDAKQENYSIKNDKEQVDIYTYNMDDNNILVLIRENTVITSKTPMQIIKDDNMTIDIKEKLSDNNYYKYALSNINYNNNRKVELIKVYVIFVIIIYSFLSILINIIMLIKIKNQKSVYYEKKM